MSSVPFPSMLQIVFLIIAAFTLVGAVGTVVSRNIFHAALFLTATFFGVAGLYVLLEAPFLAVVQVLIYVGAISILIIFAIMLSRGLGKGGGAGLNDQWYLAAASVLLLAIFLTFIVGYQIQWAEKAQPVPTDAITQIGAAFVGDYVVPFEVASVLLVIALIGAIIIAREREV